MKVLSVERSVLLEVNEKIVYHITQKHSPLTPSENGITVKIWNRNFGYEPKEYNYPSKWEIFRMKDDSVAETITRAILTDKLFGLI
jgi:hypothetical protein